MLFILSSFFIANPLVIPAKAGIQETRLRDKWIAGFIGWFFESLFLWLSCLLCGNGLLKPLDSGLRRNDGRVDAGPPKPAHLSPLPVNTTSKSNAMRLSPRRHSSESWNPGNEAGGINGWQVLSDDLAGCRAFVLSFPLCGDGSYKPLDSSAFVPDTALPPASMQAGLRRAATGILPSRRIQAFLSINDGRGEFWLSQSRRAFLFRLT